MRRTSIRIAALVSSALCATAAHAQETQSEDSEGLGEIIVTATKRAESLQDVSLSVSAMQGSAVEDRALETLSQIVQYMPNVRVNGQDGPSKYVSIRGLGSGNNRGFEPSVGLYQDGVYLGREYFLFDSYIDMARVEAVKGPQGALFGRNTIAGAISVITADPTAEYSGDVMLTVGENDKRVVDAVLSGPLTESLGARLALQYFDRGGYIDDTVTGERDASRVVGAARLKLDWQANENLNFEWTTQYADLELEGAGRQLGPSVACVTIASPARCAPPNVSNPATVGGTLSLLDVARNADPRAEAIPDFRRTSGPGQDGETRSTFFTSLEANYELGEHTFTYIGAYASVPDQQTILDADSTLLAAGQLTNSEDFNQTSHEFRVTSPAGGFFDYIAGVYFYSSEVAGEQRFLTGPLGTVVANADQESESTSIFAQGTFNFTDSLRLIAGGRWNQEDKSGTLRQTGIAAIGFPTYSRSEAVSDEQVLLNGAIEYDLSDDVLLYASFAEGYKAGGLNFFDLRNQSGRYGPESSEGLEFGIKSEFFDRRLRVNATAYSTEYSDLQVAFFNGTSVIVGNAASATSEGVELEVNWLAAENLTFNLAAATGEARFDAYPTGPCTIAQQLNTVGNCVQNLAGRPLERAPDQSGSFNATYTLPLDSMPFSLVLSGDANYSSEYYHAGDLDQAALQGAYWIYNGRVALEDDSGRWALALVGKNLSEEAYVYVSANSFGFAGSRFVHVGDGRQIDLQLSYRW